MNSTPKEGKLLLMSRKRGSHDVQQAVPAELCTYFTLLQKHHHAIQQALSPLQEKMSDLERDWAPRDKAFWQEMLGMLQELKAVLQAACFLIDAPGGLFIQYTLMIELYHTLSLIDNTGIELTSYLEVCTSRRVAHLHQRRRLLVRLRELAQSVGEVLTLTGTVGREKSLEGYQERQRKRARRKQASSFQ